MISIPCEEVRRLFHYNKETGEFRWRKNNRKCGSRKGRYIVISIYGIHHLAHRLAWVYSYGATAPRQIDHINGDGQDNRLANLRAANGSQNLANSKRSGSRGVIWSRGKWRARVYKYGDYIEQYFDNLDDAKTFVKIAHSVLHREYSVFNRTLDKS